jgi:cobalt-zinc-cadmium efflux system outer membrane protein
MKTIALPLALAVALSAAPAYAQEHDHSQHDHAQPAQDEHAGHSQTPAERKPLTRRPEDRSIEPTGPALRLEELEEKALRNSPRIAEAEAAVRAAEGRAKQAGLLPNPVAGYEAEEIRTGLPLRGGKHGLFAEQTIPLGGKLGKRREVFLQEANQARAALEGISIAVRNDVRVAYFAALAEQQRVDFLARLQALVEEAVTTSYGLYNVGQADRPDVLEIEIEGRQAELASLQARNRLARARRQLAVVVGDESVALGRLEGALETAVPLVEASALDEILARSPQIAASRLGVERARANLRAQRAERIPDLAVRGGALYDRELNEVTGGAIGWQAKAEVGVTIPIFDRNQGGIAEAEAEIAAAEADVRRLELDLRMRFETAYTAYVNAKRISEVYREEIIPKANEAYDLYLRRYQEMTAAYPQVLIARRTWIQANLDYIDALEELYRSALPLRGFLLGGEATQSAEMVGPLDLPGASRTTAGRRN